MKQLFYILLLFIAFIGCRSEKQREITPWGTVVGPDGVGDSVPSSFSLDDIINQGELIMLTVTGPDTYYDYHGHGMGKQYMLCEAFTSQLGVKLRVEVCKDTTELVRRLSNGEGDVIAYPLNANHKGTTLCGPGWRVSVGNESLADTIKRWYKPDMLAKVEQEQRLRLSNGGVKRRVYAPMLNVSQGIISRYDALFIKYAPQARLDWRLLAAQCYQESCFDPQARSWAGACGLMQIMPSTATHLGLPQSEIFSPEPNISAATRYMRELMAGFPDVASLNDRICFALASYNGGIHHIRDARALARKYGRDDRRWAEVSEFVLKLQQPQYYNDPVVRNGYMRGSETHDYVNRIMQRWAQYRGSARPSAGTPADGAMPHAAKRKHKYHI